MYYTVCEVTWSNETSQTFYLSTLTIPQQGKLCVELDNVVMFESWLPYTYVLYPCFVSVIYGKTNKVESLMVLACVLVKPKDPHIADSVTLPAEE